ncbi:MAG: RHS repeat protein, partial [Clostridia bacterium]|nr:RHS repeat protein [Clostridia bacterium]
LGNTTAYQYDAMDRLLSVRQPNGATASFAYDAVGNLVSATDALGAKQTYGYDALGRLLTVTDALGQETNYGYDALDNLTLVRDANGNETRYKYDSLSRLRSETDALGNTTQYKYTPEGWLKETTRPDGTTLSYTYDKTGRLLRETASDGTEIRHSFNAVGELTELVDETGTTRLRYDQRGLLIGVESPTGDVVQYGYDAYGDKTSVTYPDGSQATYAYDSLSRLLSVTEPSGTTTAYTYDALGRRISTSDGSLKTEYRYDAVGNLTRQSNELVDLTYRYDLNGRMTEEARTEGGTTVRTGYTYDKAGQLTAFRRSDGYAEAYTYDPVGNMVEKVLNGTKIAMTYDAANELKTMESSHGTLTYAYDLNGNLTQKTLGDRTDTYAYDARNHLKQYRGYDNYEVKYSYNALGMLHARESSGNHSRTTLEELIAGKEDSDDPDGDGDGPRTTTYVYDLTQPYYEVLTETTDGVTTAYTYGLERLAAYTESTRTAYLYDGRGSVIQTVQTNIETASFADAVYTSKAYSAYGELLTEKTSGFGYNGEYYDAATGMLNLRARQYEPAQARFSQRDSLKGWSTEPRSLNAYLYCQNDAINFFDASGAAMMAVNMTDGGGGTGRTTAAKIANAAQIQAAVSRVGVIEANLSASAAATAANTHALTQAQVSSMLRESRDPAAVWQKARDNRAQAQAGMPAVSGNSFLRSIKLTACMTQEEYDAGAEIYGPQLSSNTPSPTPVPTPQPTPKPTPQPGPSPTTPVTRSEKARRNSSWKEIANTWFGAESRTTYQQNGSSETVFD